MFFSMITSYYRCTHIYYKSTSSLHLSLISCFGNHLMEISENTCQNFHNILLFKSMLKIQMWNTDCNGDYRKWSKRCPTLVGPTLKKYIVECINTTINNDIKGPSCVNVLLSTPAFFQITLKQFSFSFIDPPGPFKKMTSDPLIHENDVGIGFHTRHIS